MGHNIEEITAGIGPFEAHQSGSLKIPTVLTSFHDSESLDAFGRLRVSNPLTLFESKLLGSANDPLLWDEQTRGGGGMSASTPTADAPYVDFTSTVSQKGQIARQTFRHFTGQLGKSDLTYMSGVLQLTPGGTGTSKTIGRVTDANGAFFESFQDVVRVVIRNTHEGVLEDEVINQADWNIDTMDGDNDDSNPSGITADFSVAQMFIVDFQWPIGRVRFGLVIGGSVYYVHADSHANEEDHPWSSTPSLPLRYEMTTTDSSPATSMRCMGSVAVSEGGAEDRGIVRHAGTRGTHVDCNAENVLYAIVAIRLKPEHLGATITTERVSVLETTGNKTFEWLLIFNADIAGELNFQDVPSSSIERALGSTANIVTGGFHLGGDFSASAQKGGGSGISIATELKLGSSITGVRDIIVLCAGPVGGSANIDIEGAITWRETL